MKKNYKKLAVLVAVLMLTLSIASTGFAADTVANLTAYYRNIKMYRNGTQVQISAEPFIVNGTTYLPVRAISELLDKEVTWDQATYSIGVNDRPGTNVQAMASQILNQQLTIAQLEAKVKTLTAQVGSSMDLDDLEDELNDKYDEYEDIEFKIVLDGNEDDIVVEIYVDLYDFLDEWNALSDPDLEDYLQDIVDDILDEYEEADIEGFIEDSDEDEELESFTVSSSGSVSLDGSSLSDYDIDDLEEYLNNKYEDYYSSDDVYFEIDLSGNANELQVDIEAYDEDDDDLLNDITYDLTKTEVKALINKIYNDILDTDEFEDADVYGYIIDYSGELDFDYDSGSLYLEW